MGLVFSDGYTKDKEVIDKEREYANYILDHIMNVQIAYNKLIKDRIFEPVEIEVDNGITWKIDNWAMDDAKKYLEFEVKNHDLSKFSEEEFIPYRIHFFPTETEKKRIESDPEYAAEVEASFREAWQHHWLNNPHHAKKFVFELQEDGSVKRLDTPQNMSEGDILHMICDWAAMSMKFQGDMAECVTWYNTKADDEKSYMSPTTKAITEYFLKLFFDKEIV